MPVSRMQNRTNMCISRVRLTSISQGTQFQGSVKIPNVGKTNALLRFFCIISKTNISCLIYWTAITSEPHLIGQENCLPSISIYHSFSFCSVHLFSFLTRIQLAVFMIFTLRECACFVSAAVIRKNISNLEIEFTYNCNIWLLSVERWGREHKYAQYACNDYSKYRKFVMMME